MDGLAGKQLDKIVLSATTNMYTFVLWLLWCGWRTTYLFIIMATYQSCLCWIYWLLLTPGPSDASYDLLPLQHNPICLLAPILSVSLLLRIQTCCWAIWSASVLSSWDSLVYCLCPAIWYCNSPLCLGPTTHSSWLLAQLANYTHCLLALNELWMLKNKLQLNEEITTQWSYPDSVQTFV